jgi:hypothetical protein
MLRRTFRKIATGANTGHFAVSDRRNCTAS